MYSIMQTGLQLGMQTLEHALKDLYTRRQITLEDALLKTNRPDEFKRLAGVN